METYAYVKGGIHMLVRELLGKHDGEFKINGKKYSKSFLIPERIQDKIVACYGMTGKSTMMVATLN